MAIIEFVLSIPEHSGLAIVGASLIAVSVLFRMILTALQKERPAEK